MKDNLPSLDELISQAESKKKPNEKTASTKPEDEKIRVLEK